MITVNFFTLLRLVLNISEIQLDASPEAPIRDVLRQAEAVVFERTSHRFLMKLLNDDGAIKRGTIILINGKNILDTNGLENLVRDGDVVALFPPGGGG